MSSYLREMNAQVWWMVDIGLSDALEDCLQTQGQKKYIYLEAHASNALSSVVGPKEQIIFGMRLSKCMAQAVTRHHQQMYQRISHQVSTMTTMMMTLMMNMIMNVTPRVSNPHDYVNHMFKRP
jgi:hypothetical protein